MMAVTPHPVEMKTVWTLGQMLLRSNRRLTSLRRNLVSSNYFLFFQLISYSFNPQLQQRKLGDLQYIHFSNLKSPSRYTRVMSPTSLRALPRNARPRQKVFDVIKTKVTNHPLPTSGTMPCTALARTLLIWP